jgi:hypothetical protein
MTTAAFELLILINPNVAPAGIYTIAADGAEAQRFALTGKGGEVIEVRVPIPRTASKLTVARRSAMPVVGAMLGGEQRTFDLIGVDMVTAPLRDEPPAASLATLKGSVDQLLAAMGWSGNADDLDLGFEDVQAGDAIRAAELRLGFALDPRLRAVLETAGPVRLQDSRMTLASELATTEQQFVSLWGHPETVSAETLAIYRASTMVWVEAGDGYGAVIYQPKGPEHCDGAPAYWKIHQEHIDAPELILGADGRCGGLAEALFPMFVRELMERIDDEGGRTQLLVDPTMSGFPLWLENDGEGAPRLRPDWSKLR